MNLFTQHPRSVGESYWQHMGVALTFSASLLIGAVAALVHAVFPFLCSSTSSGIVMRLHKRIMDRKRAEVMTALHDTHAERFAHLGADAVRRFKLLEELVATELQRDDHEVPRYSREVSGA